ncbi:MAG: hypothetical protein ABI130_04405 [Leifsonia sp.]
MTTGFQSVAAAVLQGLPTGGRVLVGIDGVDGSGKTTFTETLASAITDRGVVIIHLDDFLNPPHIRHRRGRDSPDGFWLDTYDYRALKTLVMDPLCSSGSGRYRTARLDPIADVDAATPVLVAEVDAVVLIEGMFLHRDELAGVWDRSVFLDVAFTETARRTALRDGSNPDPNMNRCDATSLGNASTSTAPGPGNAPIWSSTTQTRPGLDSWTQARSPLPGDRSACGHRLGGEAGLFGMLMHARMTVRVTDRLLAWKLRRCGAMSKLCRSITPSGTTSTEPTTGSC